MRIVTSCLLPIVLLPFLANGQGTRPIPPGYVEAGKRPDPLAAPPSFKSRGVDVQQLKRDADEFNRLVTVVPPQIDEVLQGKLPKDLQDNLKRVEKLARKLRSEVSPQ
jgi:hypothetical protein